MPGFLLKITMAGSLVPSAIHAKTIVKWDRSWLVVPTAIAFTPTQSTVIMTRERKKDGSLVHISYLRQEKRELISFLCDKMLERNSFVFKIAILSSGNLCLLANGQLVLGRNLNAFLDG